MDIIIYGAGQLGKKALEVSRKYRDITVKGFADTYKQGTYEGYPIINIAQDTEKYAGIPIVIAVGGFVETRKEIYYYLRRMGLNNIFYYWNKTFCAGHNFLADECVSLAHKPVNILFYAEMSVIDYCNLNCQGCNHYAPIFPKQRPDIEDRMEDVRKIGKLYAEVIEFGLIGGEPLLNPELAEYIRRTSEILPRTRLQMVTNGLLLPTVEDDTLKCIKEHQVLVVISEYVPTAKMLPKAIQRLQQYGIDYEIRSLNIKKTFYKTLSRTSHSRYPKKCISLGCTNICDGRIARCPTVLYIEKLNQMFDVNFPTDGIYKLKDDDDGGKLDQDLQRRIPLCDYCIDYPFVWAPCGGKPQLEDFVVDE